jgi:hypothetical protein
MTTVCRIHSQQAKEKTLRTAEVQSEYRNLPLASLSGSGINPRRSFNDAALLRLEEPTYSIEQIAAKCAWSPA